MAGVSDDDSDIGNEDGKFATCCVGFRINSAARWIFAWQQPPPATSAERVRVRVDDGTRAGRALASTRQGCGELRSDDGPRGFVSTRANGHHVSNMIAHCNGTEVRSATSRFRLLQDYSLRSLWREP